MVNYFEDGFENPPTSSGDVNWGEVAPRMGAVVASRLLLSVGTNPSAELLDEIARGFAGTSGADEIAAHLSTEAFRHTQI